MSRSRTKKGQDFTIELQEKLDFIGIKHAIIKLAISDGSFRSQIYRTYKQLK